MHSFYKKILLGFLDRKRSAIQCVYFIRSKHSFTLYISTLQLSLLYLTDPQTHSHDCFLKQFQSFLCKQKLENNCSVLPKDADRKITVYSSNTLLLCPSLSPYRQTDRQTDGQMHTVAACGLEEPFSSCAVVSVYWFWREIVVGVTYVLTVQYSTVVALCQFFGSGRKQLLVLLTYLLQN